MCENEDNFTKWLLTPDNWVHNRMTRMVHGRMSSGNLCRITPRREKMYWESVLKRYKRRQEVFGEIPEEINSAPEILMKAKFNLMKNFVLWGDTFEIERFFCILKNLAKNKAKKLNPAKITKPRKSRSKIESPEEKLLNDEIIFQKNVLDKELYDWAMNPWHDIKVKYANVCP